MPEMAPRQRAAAADRRLLDHDLATQAAAKPTMPRRQPRMACQPAVSSTGGPQHGHATTPARPAGPTRATCRGPTGRPEAARAETSRDVTALGSTGERNETPHTDARAHAPERAATGRRTGHRLERDETPSGMDGGARAGKGHAHGPQARVPPTSDAAHGPVTALLVGKRSRGRRASARSASTWPSSASEVLEARRFEGLEFGRGHAASSLMAVTPAAARETCPRDSASDGPARDGADPWRRGRGVPMVRCVSSHRRATRVPRRRC